MDHRASEGRGLRRFRQCLNGVALVAGMVLCLPFAMAGNGDKEPYSVRPKILKMTGEAKAVTDPHFEKIKRAHLEFVAQLIETYPDKNTHFYFLARDSELLYDLMKLWTQNGNDRENAARIHLLNVSRANKDDVNLKAYLNQKGLSEENLRKGQQALFIDTGFTGSIPKAISGLFPSDLQSHLQSHMILSENPEIPSSRTFMTALNPAAAYNHPTRMRGTISAYEEMARFTDRSNSFEKIDGKWRPMSPIGGANDGKVDPEAARNFMLNFKAYALSPSAQELFQARRKLWRGLKEAQKSGNSERIREALASVLQSNDEFKEAIVRDFLETSKINFKMNESQLPNPKELNLAPVTTTSSMAEADLVKKHPEWKSILQSPDEEIPSLLLKQKSLHSLRSILDIYNDAAFSHRVVKALFEVKTSDPTLKNEIERTISAMIDKTVAGFDMDVFYQTDAVSKAITTPAFAHLAKPYLGRLIEKNNNTLLQSLTLDFFSRPHGRSFHEEEELIKQKMGNVIRNYSVVDPTGRELTYLKNLAEALGKKELVSWKDAHESMRPKVREIIKEHESHPNKKWDYYGTLLQILSHDYADRWTEYHDEIREWIKSDEVKKLAKNDSQGWFLKNMSSIGEILSKDYAKQWNAERDFFRNLAANKIDTAADWELPSLLSATKSPVFENEHQGIKEKLRKAILSGNSFDFLSYAPDLPQWKNELEAIVRQGNPAISAKTLGYIFKNSEDWPEGKKLLANALVSHINQLDSVSFQTLWNTVLQYPKDPALRTIKSLLEDSVRSKVKTALDNGDVKDIPQLLINYNKFVPGFDVEVGLYRKKLRQLIKNSNPKTFETLPDIMFQGPGIDWTKEANLYRGKLNDLLSQKDLIRKELLQEIARRLQGQDWTKEEELFRDRIRDQIDDSCKDRYRCKEIESFLNGLKWTPKWSSLLKSEIDLVHDANFIENDKERTSFIASGLGSEKLKTQSNQLTFSTQCQVKQGFQSLEEYIDKCKEMLSAASNGAHYLSDQDIMFLSRGFVAPEEDSNVDIQDLDKMRRMHEKRTESDCKTANAEMDVNFTKFFGPPMVSSSEASALGEFMKDVETDVDKVVWNLKEKNPRNRPFKRGKEGVSLCPQTSKSGAPGSSYPSGHAAIGYLQGLVLSEVFPQRREALLKRAKEIGKNRVVLGVHHPSDVKAGQDIADLTFKLMIRKPGFLDALSKLKKSVHSSSTDSSQYH